jgi:type II secretion system protein G
MATIALALLVQDPLTLKIRDSGQVEYDGKVVFDAVANDDGKLKEILKAGTVRLDVAASVPIEHIQRIAKVGEARRIVCRIEGEKVREFEWPRRKLPESAVRVVLCADLSLKSLDPHLSSPLKHQEAMWRARGSGAVVWLDQEHREGRTYLLGQGAEADRRVIETLLLRIEDRCKGREEPAAVFDVDGVLPVGLALALFEPLEKKNFRLGFTANPRLDESRSANDAVNAALARQAIKALAEGLARFRTDADRFPTTREGLVALLRAPGGFEWKGPYVALDAVPKDPWGRLYLYRCPGVEGRPYDLLSTGPDGVEGTSDDLLAR